MNVPYAAIGCVKDEKPALHLFVNVAGEYLDGLCVCGRYGMTLVDPLADKHIQELVLGTQLGWLLSILYFFAPLGSGAPAGAAHR